MLFSVILLIYHAVTALRNKLDCVSELKKCLVGVWAYSRQQHVIDAVIDEWR